MVIPLIDELVWHLEQGRMPIAVVKQIKGDVIGFEFRCEKEKPHFLKIGLDMLDENWDEAQEIIASFPQLASIEYVVD